MLGPQLSTPLSKVIKRYYGIKFHLYADHAQLFIHLPQRNATSAFNRMNSCLHDVQEWMSSSKLKLNPDKTAFINFGYYLSSLSHPAEKVRNLDVLYDEDFSFADLVSNAGENSFVQLPHLRRIRQYLMLDMLHVRYHCMFMMIILVY